MPIKLSELIDTNNHARTYIWYKTELLLLQTRDKIWTIPGGHIKKGERPEEAAVREVKEEIGIELPMEPRRIREVDNDEGGVLYLFEVQTNQKFEEIRPSRDFRQFKWFEIDSIPTHLMTPIIAKNIKI